MVIMKTIEEKARAYDKVINKLSRLMEKGVEPLITRADVQDFFPELKESEDEKIKKAIKKVIINYDRSVEVKTDDMLAWLEKQGEQKPIWTDNDRTMAFTLLRDVDQMTYISKEGKNERLEWLNSLEDKFYGEQKPDDKVEPKFKVGDWVVYECGDETVTLQIARIVAETYEFTDESTINVEDEDTLHLWSISDAKDGDVLTSIGFHSNCTFIFDGLDNWKFDEPNGDRAVATGHCCITASSDKIEFGVQGPDCIEVNSVKPATKIQRDFLFQKMQEAGYEWDADGKQLLSLKAEPKNKQKSVDETSIAIKNEEAYRIGFADGEAYANEQKPAKWSEEDSKRLQRIIDFLWYNRKGDTDTIYQQEQDIDWLKSLRPQNHWKPSDEQMEALNAMILNGGLSYVNQNATLIELYNELKKLKD